MLFICIKNDYFLENSEQLSEFLPRQSFTSSPFKMHIKWNFICILQQDARGPAGYFPPQISSKKTTGQQICSLLILFNIPIYEVCRKFDKNCIKNFDNWKILGFFVIFGFNLIYFSFRKVSLSLRKSILDNEFLPFLSR